MRTRPPVVVAASLVLVLIVMLGHAAGPRDLLVIVRDGKYGFVDHAGDLKIAPTFDEARWFSEGLAAVRIGARWGFVDSSGCLRVPAVYDETWLGFHEGLAAVGKGKHWGFVEPSSPKALRSSGRGSCPVT